MVLNFLVAAAFLAVGVLEEDFNGDIHFAANPREIGAIAETVYAKVAHATLGVGAAAAYKGYGRRKLRSCRTYIHQLDIYIVQLLLLHAGIIYFLYLYANSFCKPSGAVSGNSAGAYVIIAAAI